jgi:hypothetical protein
VTDIHAPLSEREVTLLALANVWLLNGPRRVGFFV